MVIVVLALLWPERTATVWIGVPDLSDRLFPSDPSILEVNYETPVMLFSFRDSARNRDADNGLIRSSEHSCSTDN